MCLFITFEAMRTILLWCTVLFTAQLTWAQTSFSVSTTRVSTSAPADAYAFYKWIVVSNNTTQDIDMRWKIVEESIPTGWEAFVEDVDSAYLVHKDSADFVIPAVAGLNDFMIVSFKPNYVMGFGRVLLNLHAVNDPTDSVLLTFNARAIEPDVDTNAVDTTTTITETELLEWFYYPTPATNKINLQSSELMYSVQLFNVNGQQLSTALVNNKQYSMSVEDHPAGTYLMRLTWVNGRSATELIQVQ